MFASNTAEIINFEKPISKIKNNDIFSKILYIHKKLKEIAQYESISKTKYNVAKLSSEKLEKVKTLESKLGCYLIAYEVDAEVEENKCMILNRISSLLDEYLDLCRDTVLKKQEDGFNGFFEQ